MKWISVCCVVVGLLLSCFPVLSGETKWSDPCLINANDSSANTFLVTGFEWQNKKWDSVQVRFDAILVPERLLSYTPDTGFPKAWDRISDSASKELSVLAAALPYAVFLYSSDEITELEGTLKVNAGRIMLTEGCARNSERLDWMQRYALHAGLAMCMNEDRLTDDVERSYLDAQEFAKRQKRGIWRSQRLVDLLNSIREARLKTAGVQGQPVIAPSGAHGSGKLSTGGSAVVRVTEQGEGLGHDAQSSGKKVANLASPPADFDGFGGF